MTDSESHVWLVTGSSTGMGRALAEAIVERGDRLIATARDIARVEDLAERGGERFQAARLDVLEPASIAAAIAGGLARFGKIDTLVHCAGAGLVGSIEESSRSEIERVFETNMYGVLNTINGVLPHMRERRSGQIGVITSQGAFQGQQGCGIYCASKAATNAICEALAAEVAALGIGVTIIEPGLVATNFHSAIVQAEQRLPDYDASCGPLRRAVLEGNPPTAHDARLAADAILAALSAPRPPLNMPLGADAVNLVRHKLAFVTAELDRWEDVAVTVKGSQPLPGPGEPWNPLQWGGPLVGSEQI
jgi:NADP-dependent 3-hydroxy acid dehydrogenase YdfG